jgi:hypothetical protein
MFAGLLSVFFASRISLDNWLMESIASLTFTEQNNVGSEWHMGPLIEADEQLGCCHVIFTEFGCINGVAFSPFTKVCIHTQKKQINN